MQQNRKQARPLNRQSNIGNAHGSKQLVTPSHRTHTYARTDRQTDRDRHTESAEHKTTRRAQYSPCSTTMIHSRACSAVLLVANLPDPFDDSSRDAIRPSRDRKIDTTTSAPSPTYYIGSFCISTSWSDCRIQSARIESPAQAVPEGRELTIKHDHYHHNRA